MPAKVTKLIGLKRPPFLSPTNLIIFACTQNGELKFMIIQSSFFYANSIDKFQFSNQYSKFSNVVI